MSVLRAFYALALVSAFATPSISVAADYFICYNGSDCNSGAGSGWVTGNSANPGTSKDAPWRCPHDMEGNLSAGDVVVMGDGNYTFSNCGSGNEMLSVEGMDGTAAEPIVIKAENQWGAVLDGEETNPDDAGRNKFLVKVRNCSYIRFENFETMRAKTSFHGNSFTNICHDVTWKGMRIHDNGFTGILTAFNYYNITLNGNFIYDGKDSSLRNENHTCVHNHIVYLKGYNITLTNNVMHSSGGGSLVTVAGICSVLGANDPVNFTHTIHAINNTFDGNGCVATYTEPTSGDKRYNAMDFFSRAFAAKNCSDLGGTPRNFKNVRFENNLFLNGQSASKGGEESQFVGNTNSESIQNPPSCNHWPWWSDSCETAARGLSGYLEFRNNVAETRVQNASHQQWTTDYNNNCDECDAINVENEAGHDYKPTVNSTALVGKGRSENAPSHDIAGNPRNPTSIDIGAYQFSTTGPTRPNPPSLVDN